MVLTNLWLAGNKLAFFLLQAQDQKSGDAQSGTEDFSLLGMIRKMK